MTMTETRRKLARKEADMKRFDALPKEEQKRLTDQGLNPHEPEVVRRAKQARVKKQIDKYIERLPKRVRDRIRSRNMEGRYTTTTGFDLETRPGKF